MIIRIVLLKIQQLSPFSFFFLLLVDVVEEAKDVSALNEANHALVLVLFELVAIALNMKHFAKLKIAVQDKTRRASINFY